MENALTDFLHYCRIERRLAPLTCSAYERDVTACLRFLQAAGASGWAAVVTWKWNVVIAYFNSLTPAHIILGAAGAQTAQSLSLTFFAALITLASVTVMLAFMNG